jgi:hypothetical protein
MTNKIVKFVLLINLHTIFLLDSMPFLSKTSIQKEISMNQRLDLISVASLSLICVDKSYQKNGLRTTLYLTQVLYTK